jgi:hypothetical protein
MPAKAKSLKPASTLATNVVRRDKRDKSDSSKLRNAPPGSKTTPGRSIASGPASTLANRIVGHGEMSVAKLKANPANWRTHSEDQRQTMKALLGSVGWVQTVIYNRRTKHLIDGHLRVAIAAERGEKWVPVPFVDLPPNEEREVLATFDPIGDLAGIDEKNLERFLAGLKPESAALAKVIAALETELGIGKPDEADEALLDQAVQLEPGKEFDCRHVRNEDE